MNPQTLARLTGVLFLITYVTSIPALFVFYAPVLHDPGYITGAARTPASWWERSWRYSSSSRTSAPPWRCSRS